MTRDYAKPSTTRTPSGKKPGKKKPSVKKTEKKTSSSTSSNSKSQSSSKKHSKASAHISGRSSGSIFFHITLIAIVLGGFGYALYKLAQVPGEAELAPETPISAPQSDESTSSQKPKQQIEAPEARFQFYHLLPNSEVDTGTVDAYTFKEKGAAEEYLYILQTGSFRSAKDAERQKATIAFQGIKARVSAVASSKGTTWHRVEAGPYESRSEMNAALDKLYAINIQPLVKKSKK